LAGLDATVHSPSLRESSGSNALKTPFAVKSSSCRFSDLLAATGTSRTQKHKTICRKRAGQI
jgi:hypothetical protein